MMFDVYEPPVKTHLTRADTKNIIHDWITDTTQIKIHHSHLPNLPLDSLR